MSGIRSNASALLILLALIDPCHSFGIYSLRGLSRSSSSVRVVTDPDADSAASTDLYPESDSSQLRLGDKDGDIVHDWSVVEYRGYPDFPVNDVKNLRVPQIHLPPRFVPGAAWQNHHRATRNFVREHQHSQTKQPTLPVNRDHPQYPNRGFLSNIIPKQKLVSSTGEWKRLQKHVEHIDTTHLRDLIGEADRCDAMYAEHDGVYLDFSRQRATLETMELLRDLACRQNLESRIEAMFNGEKINFTEDRAVLHTALRAKKESEGTVMVDDVDVIKEVHEVKDQIKIFTDGVRSGTIRGYTGKRLRNIVSVGIGGSYLGPEFLHEVLKTEPEGVNAALGYSLRFLANVDPVDVERTCADLDPEETLIVIVSKTFTTAETMLNARTMRQWLWDFMGNDVEVVKKHVVACASTSATEKVKAFGVDTENCFFRFWDWVGGRYSVCSAAGAVPISLLYGFELFEKFLDGARSMDEHYRNAPFEKNLPVIMGLLGVWNLSFLGYKTRTTLPYCQALLKLPSHIQQLDMESNGKTMTMHNVPVDYQVGEIDFGEPGTNGQHSFYQLLHMGQTVPCEFIGFLQSQRDLCLDDEPLSSHDELMSNFFAQPDALATGKSAEKVREEGTKEELIPHKVFEGNRPSSSILLPKLTAYAAGQLLALYEHRTATQGFIWDINSFDQWGVELGKQLAINVKSHLLEARQSDDDNHRVEAENPATTRILNYYLNNGEEDFCRPDNLSSKDVTSKSRREHFPPERHDLCGKNGKLAR